MIEYVEIRGSDTNVIGIIDTAKSIIWHTVYFGVGDFEIYSPVTPDSIALLQIGHYVTRPDNVEVGIIERINIVDNEQDGTMIIATGRFVKSILDRRLIYKLTGTSNAATILRGNVETAVRVVVKNNAIACAFDSRRNIALLALGDLSNIPLRIVDGNGNATGDVKFNPNGSVYAIEGITSPDGRVFGKMGHAERIGTNLYKNVPGAYDIRMFEAAVKYFR